MNGLPEDDQQIMAFYRRTLRFTAVGVGVLAAVAILLVVLA